VNRNFSLVVKIIWYVIQHNLIVWLCKARARASVDGVPGWGSRLWSQSQKL